MRKIAGTWIVIAGLAVPGYWSAGAGQAASQSQPQAQAGTPQQDAASLTPPPAYTPRPKGAPPYEDTPAQKEALARWKARA